MDSNVIEKNKRYTLKQLRDLLGDDWKDKLGIKDIPKFLIPKPRINSFDEFDDDTKRIYIGIYNLIKRKNPNQNFNVWATGSRVKGKWRTVEETDEIAFKYNIKPKYSDYDYISDAKIIPTAREFLKEVRAAVDFAGSEGHKVLIVF